jgi:glycosyltransferase involved in cell wall biosynthesis
MKTPLVSIVSLLYDVKTEYVNECIESLLNQTYKNIEIIFVDDCSPTINYDYIKKISSK